MFIKILPLTSFNQNAIIGPFYATAMTAGLSPIKPAALTARTTIGMNVFPAYFFTENL